MNHCTKFDRRNLIFEGAAALADLPDKNLREVVVILKTAAADQGGASPSHDRDSAVIPWPIRP